MKSSPLTTVLLVALVLSALASVVLCYQYISGARELRQLQATTIGMQNNRAFIAQLAAEALEYSKKNPAINPILEAAGVKPAASTNKPAGK